MDDGCLGSSGGDSTFFEVLLDEHLFPILVDDALSVSNEEGHDEMAEVTREATKERGDGSCREAVDGAVDEAVDGALDETVDDEGRRSVAGVEEGENCL